MSYTKDLMMESLEKVDAFLEDGRCKALEAQKVRKVGNIGNIVMRRNTIAHTIARKLGIEIMGRMKYDNVSEFYVGYYGRQSCLATFKNIIEQSERFDQVRDMLSNDESKDIFDWFIKYRVAYSVIGNMAGTLFPTRISESIYREAEKVIRKNASRGLLKIDGFLIKAPIGEVIHALLFEQYRIPDICEPAKEDIVIDAGACMGDTALFFEKYCGKQGTIYAFEPFESNFKVLGENIKRNNLKNIFAVKEGFMDMEGFLSMSGASGQASVRDNGNYKIKVTTIDKFVERNNLSKVDFIKMDIEGAELKALKGGKNTIKRFKPKLAICVYHRGDDILTIPEYIKSLGSDYKLYLKHNSTGMDETVLYAII